jgi:catechol 2,3-dioxygenase-like lactoylglutathione lyase family enzyme
MHTTLRALLLTLPLAACAATSTSVPAEHTNAVQAAEQPSVPHAPAPARVAGVEFETEASIVSVHVRDMDAAKAWYQRVLGSQVYYELAEQGWCEVTTPARGLLLGLNLNPAATPSESSALGFGVKDMVAAKDWLMKNQVTLEGDVITIPGVVHLLYFADPDGNKLWFYQPL